MEVIYLCGFILSLSLILAVPALRYCGQRLVERAILKQREYAAHPEKYNAQRTWGAGYNRYVHGKRVDNWQVLPEQLESARELKSLLPQRTPDNQSVWWTITFYGLVAIGTLFLLLALPL